MTALDTLGKASSRVYQHVRSHVFAPGATIGDRLPSTGQLATALSVSRPTVLRALERLEHEGLVRRRQGAGCYIASPVEPLSLRESVVLCMEGRGHVWSELTGLITRRLQRAGCFTSLIDTSYGMTVEPLLERVAYSDSRCVIVHGHRNFPFEMLRLARERGKIILAAGEWQHDDPELRVGGVVSDLADGGRQVADHLWARGHRHILLAGTHSQIWALRQGDTNLKLHRNAFLARWRELGGSYQTLPCDIRAEEPGAEPYVEPREAVRALNGTPTHPAPTAVHGLLDACTYAVQRALQRRAPQRLHELEWVGFFDTPWARAGHPPFSSVGLQLREVADRLDALVREVFATEDPHFTPPLETVQPRLNLRQMRS